MKEEGRWRTAFFCGVLGCMGEGSWLVGLVWFFCLFVQRFLEDFLVFLGGLGAWWVGWWVVCACLAGLDVGV